MQLFCFEIKPDIETELAWEELQLAGVNVLYSSEDVQIKQIYGLAPPELPPLAHILSKTLAQLPSIDWQNQWQLHGADFHEGFVHVEAAGQLLKLEPGPGFGDLSHPTTRLVLKLMEPHIQGRVVFDLGCGSGILSLCAAALDAKRVVAIDIDPYALDHARRNALHNGLENFIEFCLPHEVQIEAQEVTVLMNMIQSEQIAAWESLRAYHAKVKESITSGILLEDQDKYLALTKSWGWSKIEAEGQNGWLGFRFRC